MAYSPHDFEMNDNFVHGSHRWHNEYTYNFKYSVICSETSYFDLARSRLNPVAIRYICKNVHHSNYRSLKNRSFGAERTLQEFPLTTICQWFQKYENNVLAFEWRLLTHLAFHAASALSGNIPYIKSNSFLVKVVFRSNASLALSS